MTELYLGIDGGQSHTEAIIGNRAGEVVGRGRGGPSNHAEQPGGRERLRQAVTQSVSRALQAAGGLDLARTEFASAYCAMTGGAEYKTEVICQVLRTPRLVVAHDAPAAWAGALGGQPGVVVIAGPGSVVYGANAQGQTARAGGWGHLFSDEGSGFWLAAQGVRHALRAHDGLGPATALNALALARFKQPDLRALTLAVYAGTLARDGLARFAEDVQAAAASGDEIARAILDEGCCALARMVQVVAQKLGLAAPLVSGIGGVWRGALARELFGAHLRIVMPAAQIIKPLLGPAAGALLLAYRAVQIELNHALLAGWEKQGGNELGRY